MSYIVERRGMHTEILALMSIDYFFRQWINLFPLCQPPCPAVKNPNLRFTIKFLIVIIALLFIVITVVFMIRKTTGSGGG